MRAARLSSRRGLCAAPLACRRFSRSIRPPARLLSSEPPKPPPPAFRNFAPRTKGSAAEKGADGVHARSEGGGGGGSSGGGGGGGNGGGGWPSASQLANFAATSAGLGLATFVIFGGRGEGGGGAQKEISMQHFMSNMLATGRVGRLVVVNGTIVRVHLYESSQSAAAEPGFELQQPLAPLASAVPDKPAEFYFTIGSLDSFEERLEAAQNELGVPLRDHVPVAFVSQRSWASEAGRYVPSLLLIGFLVAMSRGALGGGIGGMGGGGGLFNVGKSKAIKASKVQTRFKDVAGLQESKAEVMEFVDILQNPERYTKLGAKIPKGALLVGPPGCGKTLLAKATAGESKAPFYSISGSDFIEMFVGVGPARVRDLFAQAKAMQPCIVFIDEIDAVGKARGRGGNFGGNDERENTLNQLLIELDGFSPSSGIVVLAGTNRADVLDPALLRPGRFDRQIVVDKPDITGRAEIFRVHLGALKLDADSESWSQKMAALTPGFSGAEIANVCNEAALIAARRSESVVTAECFDAAIDRVIAGIEKKDLTIDPYERRVVAFHEAGHALCGWLLEHADPVMKVSIVPRGQSALGYSQSLPRDVPLYTEGQLDDMMCMALGGRAAEQVIFNEVSSGAQNDLQRVTQMAHSQVTVYGLSSRVGPLSFGQQEESNTLYRPYSEKTARVIDEEVSKIIDASYERAVSLLTEHRDKLTALAESLLEKEVIGSDDLIRVLGERPFSKSVDYDEFVNASWKRKLETADDAGEDAGGGGGGGSGGGGGEELPPAQAAA
mmetsp:Transcript_11897/g.38106  ORF Transcript_11897/g.38106 Transcript_11897/m.38106 type:complete len:780 (+) Transcript_11897:38-2377(+)